MKKKKLLKKLYKKVVKYMLEHPEQFRGQPGPVGPRGFKGDKGDTVGWSSGEPQSFAPAQDPGI